MNIALFSGVGGKGDRKEEEEGERRVEGRFRVCFSVTRERRRREAGSAAGRPALRNNIINLK